MNHPVDFGAWVKRHRKALRLTQGQVAKRAGVSTSYISSIERRAPHSQTGVPVRPERDTILQIAKAVGGSADEALVICGLLPVAERTIPEAIRIISFDGLDQEDVQAIADFISWKKSQK